MSAVGGPARGRAAVLAGVGGALPSRVVTNDDLAGHLDTSDEWIRTMTGIRQRRFADSGTTTGDLATAAGAQALKSAGTAGADLVVLATTTPDRPCPGTAPTVASRLGLGNVPAYDVAAVCSGFLYALAAAAGAIGTGLADSALVIGAEVFTSLIDPADRGTAVIFGDGAGAVLLRAGDAGEPGALLGFDLGSDGEGVDLITVPEAGGHFTMAGRKVFTRAVTHMAGSARTVLDRVGWDAGSVDWFVGHQANLRILNSTAEALGVDPERVVVHLDEVGNTSAASVPLALAASAAAGRLRAGDRVLLSAFGGGLTWGSAALTWPRLAAAPEVAGA
ncbi:MAG: beta-ketoacyl-ACP synthase III [Catenulispora sp.]